MLKILRILSQWTQEYCVLGVVSTKVMILTHVIQAEVTRNPLTHHKNMFTQDEQQLQEVEKVVVKKYGQRGKEGVRVARLDSWLLRADESHVFKKRELLKGGVRKEKTNIIGNQLPSSGQK